MSNTPDSHEVKQQVRKHLIIFVALLILTLINVGASFVHVSSTAGTVTFALTIALVEAVLVAGFMMHLVGERKMIHIILAPTVVFFAALMYLILWALAEGSHIHLH